MERQIISKNILWTFVLLQVACLFSCNNSKKTIYVNSFEKGTFGYDLYDLLKKDSNLIVLKGDGNQSQIIISPRYQAKVFASTAIGLSGPSLGYVSYNLLDTEQIFPNGCALEYITTESWKVGFENSKNVVLRKKTEINSYQGNYLKLGIERKISLIERPEIAFGLSVQLQPDVKAVGYETYDVITNLNDFEWAKETCVICLWMLDMYKQDSHTNTNIPSRVRMNGGKTETVAGNYNSDMKELTITTFENAPQAVFLKPAQSMSAKHSVYHFIGEEQCLNPIVQKVFGISTDDIKNLKI